MKRKKKTTRIKRLTRNEVATVADMQKKIDCYEFFILLLHRMILRKSVIPIPETYVSNWQTGYIYNFVKSKIKRDEGKSFLEEKLEKMKSRIPQKL